MDPPGLNEADQILSGNLKSLENELCNLLETECELSSTGKLENHNRIVYPANWPEMVNMCANVFSTQGKSQFGFFMKMTPHEVQTYFDPKNCSNDALVNRQTVVKSTKSKEFWNVNRFGSHHNQSSAHIFNRRFPRRSSSLSAVPKIGSKLDLDEDVSFESLQIGPKWRHQNSPPNMMDLLRRACGYLSNLANQRQIIEINYFHTLDVTHTNDYVTEIASHSLLNNLDFVIKTALSEAAMIEWILRNFEMQGKDLCGGQAVVSDLRTAVDCLKMIFHELLDNNPPNELLEIADEMHYLVMSVRYAQTFLWTITLQIKPEQLNGEATQRGVFIGS